MPKRIGEGRFAKLTFPPRLNYSLDKMREENSREYDMVVQVLREIAVTTMGMRESNDIEEQIRRSEYILKTGMIKPFFYETEDKMVILTFQIWSLFNAKYMEFNEMDLFEQEICDDLLTRMFHVN